MLAFFPTPALRRTTSTSRTLSFVLLGAAALCWPAPPLGAERGQWTPPPLHELNGEAVHMALLRDGVSYHSRVVWWRQQSSGNVLGWQPGNEGCESYPAASFTPPLGWSPGAEVFCSGHTQLADGRLLKVGGTDFPLLWGIPDARSYAPATGTWSARAEMKQPRWYPTATTLRDGRVLVSAGNKGEQLWFFGGKRDGAAPASGTGDLLHRSGRGVTGGYWDGSVTPLADAGLRPAPREGHTTAFLSDPADPTLQGQAVFGGRDGAGNPVVSDVWLLKRQNGSTFDLDYTYRWKLLPAVGQRPDPRSEHTALALSDTEMVVFGGLKKPAGGPETPTNEFWRLFKHTPTNTWQWEQVTASGTPPSPRYGHAAVYDDASTTNRMILFGGAEAPGQTPTDSRVYAFNFDPASPGTGSWSELQLSATSRRPKPRRDHTMAMRPISLYSLMYGGYLGPSASSDTLWQLFFSNPAQWSPIAATGTSPGPRAGHSATAAYDFGFNIGQLFIFGGEAAPGVLADPFIYVIEPFGRLEWFKWREAAFRLSGHTGALDPYGLLQARTPEIYDPTADIWSPQGSTGWLQDYYPVHFAVPGSTMPGGGRVMAVGPDPQARYLDLPAGSWQQFGTGTSGNAGFRPETGVMYQPGKILIAGGIDLSGAVVGTTKTLDAAATGGWQNRAPLAPRLRHNLVLLPTGEVLAIGGVTGTALEDTASVPCPQLWSPSNGSWTLLGDLACDRVGGTAVVRNYHSTAILLPDGRVLSAGGFPPNRYRTQARIFCPPYLFVPNTNPPQLAPRPQITSAPTSITYGEAFIIGKLGNVISSACLIRPAATTHAFDQNQRFVPLTIEALPDGTGLRAVAPPSGSHAPPGDYLLFIINQNGVPAVARWVRLGNCPTIPCDTGPPPQVANMYAGIVGPNEVWLFWDAPGDHTTPLAGAYDLRIATVPITSENAYATATQVPVSPPDADEPAVAAAGTPMVYTKYNLTACTPYSFALKTRDGVNNWSALGPEAPVTTTCEGGGGGFSARRVEGGAEGASAAGAVYAFDAGSAEAASTVSPARRAEAPLAGATGLAPAAGALVAETRRTSVGGWQVILRMVSEPEGLDPALSGGIVAPVRDNGGGWKTLGRYQPTPGQSPLGLCALRDQGRVVFPAGYALDRVVSGLRAGSHDHALSLADHSRLGSLGERFISSGGGVELVLGDALSMTYAPSGEALPGAASWYLLVRPTGIAGLSATPARREQGSAIPTRFALYQNQPNPLRHTTTIAFDLPVASPVSLAVFDLLGRRVASLAQGEHPAGAHSVEWNLREASGVPVRPGVYVYRLVAGEFRARRKMSVLP